MMGGGCTTAAIVLDAPDFVVLRCCICFALFSLRLSVTVLGPGDTAKAHDAVAERAVELEAVAAALCIMPPTIDTQLYFLVVSIIAADGLPPMDTGLLGGRSIDAFVQVEFAGNPPCRTTVVTVGGRANLVPSLALCKRKCYETNGCTTGTYILEGSRKGQCWLSGEVPNLSPMIFFEKIGDLSLKGLIPDPVFTLPLLEFDSRLWLGSGLERLGRLMESLWPPEVMIS